MWCAFGTSLRPCLSPMRTDSEWTRGGDSTVTAATQVGLGFPRFQHASQCCQHPRETAPVWASLSSSSSVCLSLSLCLIISLTLTHTHTLSLSLKTMAFSWTPLTLGPSAWKEAPEGGRSLSRLFKKRKRAEIFRERTRCFVCLASSKMYAYAILKAALAIFTWKMSEESEIP